MEKLDKFDGSCIIFVSQYTLYMKINPFAKHSSPYLIRTLFPPNFLLYSDTMNEYNVINTAHSWSVHHMIIMKMVTWSACRWSMINMQNITWFTCWWSHDQHTDDHMTSIQMITWPACRWSYSGKFGRGIVWWIWQIICVSPN